jgi:hypothetical protein
VHANCSTGCLFNIFLDEEERLDLAASAQHAAVLTTMLKRYKEIEGMVFDPDRGDPENKTVCDAYNGYGGFVGPYLP